MNNNRWFSSFAPMTTITIAAIVALSLAVASTMLALSGPWLGVVFDRNYNGPGIRIEQVMNRSPAQGRLQAGDIIKAFETTTKGRVDALPFATLEDPDQLASYTEYNSFFAHQQALWESITSPSFTAILSDDRHITLTATDIPGPEALSAGFWWLLFFGGASFLIGMSVWCLRRIEAVTRVLAISGIGFMVGAYSCAIYLTRELAMPAKLFFTLTSINHLGIMIFAYAAILFFWHYPRRISNAPVATIFVAGVAAIWLNETLQLASWPAHSFYAHFLVAYCLLVLFTTLQWRRSRNQPLERAMIKWLLTTTLICLGFTVVLFYLPTIVTGKPIASSAPTFGAVFVLYLGLITGAIRYHQFDMEHWWVKAWKWLIFLFVALCADALFVYILKLNHTASAVFTIAGGGMYFLARQWLWRQFSGNNRRALDYALPHLVDALVHQKQPNLQWQQLITRVFNPLSLKTLPDKFENVLIDRGGMALRLPGLDGMSTIEMFCCDQGKRLFSPADVNLAKLLLELMRHSRNLYEAHEQGAQEERHRIQRDLHDDVAARLLSLLHQTREPMISKVASNALRGLRDVIHLLGAEKALLEDVMSDIEAGAREQLAGLGIAFEWRAPDQWPAVTLNPQQHINLRRIAREVIANALKHANPGNIIMNASSKDNDFFLRISNDGSNSKPDSWVPGRGLNNIKSRVSEMSGSHEWGIEQGEDNRQYCYLAVQIPLSISEDLEKYPTDRRL